MPTIPVIITVGLVWAGDCGQRLTNRAAQEYAQAADESAMEVSWDDYRVQRHKYTVDYLGLMKLYWLLEPGDFPT